MKKIKRDILILRYTPPGDPEISHLSSCECKRFEFIFEHNNHNHNHNKNMAHSSVSSSCTY